MTVCKINGKEYNVIISDIEENFSILHSSDAGRTLDIGAPMVLTPIGTFIGHTVTVARKPGYEKDFDDLFNFLMQPRYDGINVEMVHNQESINYSAYVSSGKRKIERIDLNENKVYWGEMQINIVPIKAQVIPK